MFVEDAASVHDTTTFLSQTGEEKRSTTPKGYIGGDSSVHDTTPYLSQTGAEKRSTPKECIGGDSTRTNCHSVAVDLRVSIHHWMILAVHAETLLRGRGAWIHLMNGLRKARPNRP